MKEDLWSCGFFKDHGQSMQMKQLKKSIWSQHRLHSCSMSKFCWEKKIQRCCAIRSWSLAIKCMRLIKGKTNQEHMVNENRLKHLTETSAAKHTYLRGSLEMLCFFSWRNFSSINYCCPVTRPWPHCGHSESGEEEGPEVTPTLDTTALRSLAENGMGFFFPLFLSFFVCFSSGSHKL